jgi:F-type H+-transporting ATPase subunit epsilon
MSLQLRILTPTGIAVQCSADSLTATGVEGEFGILPGHLPFLCALKVGVASYQQNHQTQYLALGSGYAEIFDDKITLFVETAEQGNQIDVARAQKAIDRIVVEMAKHPNMPIDDPLYIRLNQAKERASIRLKVSTLTSSSH